MDELISRQAVIEAIEKNACNTQRIFDAVKALPSAQPERLKGEWEIKKATIHPYGNDVCCSICGHTMGSTFGYKFCPMCGADMREVNHESN